MVVIRGLGGATRYKGSETLWEGSLIAMTLHTRKFVSDDRALKDQSDLLALLKPGGLGKDSEAFRQLCGMLPLRSMGDSQKKSGDEIARALLQESVELPDGEGFSSVAPKMSVAEMVALSAQYLPILNSAPDLIEKKRKAAFGVPFAL